MARLRAEGVDFANSHSMFPTFTTANASAFATGHQIGDTGDFSNFLYSGFPIAASHGTVTPFLESDPVLREMNRRFPRGYLDEASILAAASTRYSTAAIGKVGPVGIFDLESLGPPPQRTLIVDDLTGRPGGTPLSPDWLRAFQSAGIAAAAPGRGPNGEAGTFEKPGTRVPNLDQQRYFLDVVSRVVLPEFKRRGRPFVLVYWSRDPDGTQHNQGDSLARLTPGINGPTSLAAIRSADEALAGIEAALERLQLLDSTDIIVAADHGFSTISKASRTSEAASLRYPDVRGGELPLGFLAIDLTAALQRSGSGIELFDPDDDSSRIDFRHGAHPRRGNALIGRSPSAPDVVVAANGGSDLIYLSERLSARETRRLARSILDALFREDYVSGVFVDERRLGRMAGALSTRSIELDGAAVTPHPAIVVNFTSFDTGCGRAASLCGAEVADTALQQGQGMHGSFSRADTWNFMAARGPDFHAAQVDHLPASNADIGMTMAYLLRLELPARGQLKGRLLAEALRDRHEAHLEVSTRTLESSPASGGLRTLVRTERVGRSIYLDSAGFPGRTLGLPPAPPQR